MTNTAPKVTWQDVDRVRQEHPSWGPVSIARELSRQGTPCLAAYVRATFQRRGWFNPNTTGARATERRLNVQREAPEVLPALRDRALRNDDQSQPYWLRD
jgi:hypothetical protein